jgi:hypothetical protein
MTWSYTQGSGQLSHDGEIIGKGYAGVAAGWNNPAAQDQPFVGPLPQGTYTIGEPMADGGHMGPYVLPLTPWTNNNMFGRAGFFVHGDNQSMNNTASNGCIVLARALRVMIAQSGDNTLVVTA